MRKEADGTVSLLRQLRRMADPNDREMQDTLRVLEEEYGIRPNLNPSLDTIPLFGILRSNLICFRS